MQKPKWPLLSTNVYDPWDVMERLNELNKRLEALEKETNDESER